MNGAIRYTEHFLQKVKRRFVRKEEENAHADIYWLCLADLCPQCCCGKKFDNGEAFNFHNLHHDQVPLLISEKNEIIRRKGTQYVRKEKDGLFYINYKNKEPCPFMKGGGCDIEDMKPSLCRAYPLIQLDCHVGPVFDKENCPGFDVAHQLNIRMTKKEYAIMLESFLLLQQYRLAKIKLELKSLTGPHAWKMAV